jgi:hypothetical protein
MIDPWFLQNIVEIIECEREIEDRFLALLTAM